MLLVHAALAFFVEVRSCREALRFHNCPILATTSPHPGT